MAYVSRRDRKRAQGGRATEDDCPPEDERKTGGPVRKKRKAGGPVDGAAAKRHLGQRARGGATRRAEGGSSDSPDNNMRDDPGIGGYRRMSTKNMATGEVTPGPLEPMRTRPISREDFDKEARGGRTRARGGPAPLDARGDANHPDGTDRRGEGRPEMAVPFGSPRAKGGEIERTPSGSVKASARHKAEARGHTMPGGGFPIESAHDLANAKHDVGRAKDPAAARRWINKRARELGEPPLGG